MKQPQSAQNEQPKDNLPNPFNSLYQNTDHTISNEPHIKELLDEVRVIGDTISGEVNLNYVEFKIKHNNISFVSSGAWLWKVRVYKTYKNTHKNFKRWCEDVINKSYTTALRLIKAATVWVKLATMGFETLPTSVSQCVVLYDLDDEELYDAWCLVLENLEPHLITASNIHTLIFGDTRKPNTTVKLPLDLFNTLWCAASDADMSIVELVASMYEEIYTKVANVSPFQEQRWREDLDDLVSSNT